jgi:hypothetical protein
MRRKLYLYPLFINKHPLNTSTWLLLVNWRKLLSEEGSIKNPSVFVYTVAVVQRYAVSVCLSVCQSLLYLEETRSNTCNYMHPNVMLREAYLLVILFRLCHSLGFSFSSLTYMT